VHVAVPPLGGVGHCFWQSPQWVGSVLRFTHVLPHWLSAPAHATVHPAAEQSGMAAGQIVAQPPQCAGAVMSVSQPSSALAVQCA
jgi:hypothetical protein